MNDKTDISKWYSSMVVRKEPLLSQYQHKQDKFEVGSGEILKPRKKPEKFPVLSESELVRHYYRLSRLNYSWDDGLYPLGSCTMKYNPILCEKLAADETFAALHPAMPDEHCQGALEIIYEVQSMIAEIVDLPGMSLQPAAGAHGEIAGVLMMKAWFAEHKQKRSVILIPDSAHGTNPASAAMGGYSIQKVPSNEHGLTDITALEELVDENTAALMITNPNTLGIFEKDIVKIKEILEKKGALLYVDGANLNAVMGIASFEKMGVDITQLNLHKTFSTPHGGGGPGQGALACSERMLPYLPSPLIAKTVQDEKDFYYKAIPEKTIGPIKGWYGQFGNIVRAWVYLKTWGDKIEEVSRRAVLNANYLREKLSPYLDLASQEPSMHEVVFVQSSLSKFGLTTKDFAKALLDRGFYAPTIYFPTHVQGAIMIEPTETESKEELDIFVKAVKEIFELAEEDPDKIKGSPKKSFVTSIDEVGAARKPVLTWNQM
ncbi:MAG: aminomethyl-transferring glycine dehydrogenase subunit GcvPB [Leptospirales bacterium]